LRKKTKKKKGGVTGRKRKNHKNSQSDLEKIYG
jgi:hypothetical protein